MQALTLWQPWAWAMAFAGKPVENRTWAPPHGLLGQRIAIHAGKTMDEGALAAIEETFGIVPLGYLPAHPAERRPTDPREVGHLVRGAVVAVGTLAGYVRDDRTGVIAPGLNHPTEPNAMLVAVRYSRWYQGPVGWIVVNRIALPTPIPCRGAQGIWTLPPEVEAEVQRQIAEVRG